MQQRRNKIEDLEKENNIKIKLFGRWYIESTSFEYQICKYVKDKKTKEYVKHIIGHYSNIISLLERLPDQYLKHNSNAETVQELISDVNFIKDVILKFKNSVTIRVSKH